MQSQDGRKDPWQAAERLMNSINRRSQARNERQAKKWGFNFDFANQEEIENADTNIVWSAANQEAITDAERQVFGMDKEISSGGIEEDKQDAVTFCHERTPLGQN